VPRKVNCGPSTLPPQPPQPYVPRQENLDIPDEPCRAWVSSDGEVTMLSTHTDARVDRGASLSSLHHECRPIFNSTWNRDPSQYDDRTWLMSPWFSAVGASTVYALAHMEFHGCVRVSLAFDPSLLDLATVSTQGNQAHTRLLDCLGV
jgi:hypothetical protein